MILTTPSKADKIRFVFPALPPCQPLRWIDWPFTLITADICGRWFCAENTGALRTHSADYKDKTGTECSDDSDTPSLINKCC